MKMTTTALCVRVAPASAIGFPSRVVSWKSGAVDPISRARAGAAGDSSRQAAAAVKTSRSAFRWRMDSPFRAEKGGEPRIIPRPSELTTDDQFTSLSEPPLLSGRARQFPELLFQDGDAAGKIRHGPPLFLLRPAHPRDFLLEGFVVAARGEDAAHLRQRQGVRFRQPPDCREAFDVSFLVATMAALGLPDQEKSGHLPLVEPERRGRNPRPPGDFRYRKAAGRLAAPAGAVGSGTHGGTPLNEEDRTRVDGVELPHVFIRAVEEVDRHLVVRLDGDGLPGLLDRQVVLIDRDVHLPGFREDLRLNLRDAFDRAERGLFLEEVRERR